MSAPPLEGLKASVVEKVKEGEEVFAQKEEPMAVKLASNSEIRENEEIRNSKSMLSSQADANEKKKISDMAVDEKLTPSLKIVSAMKGSRQKRGLSAEKLRVTWAADVHDPPVTSQSHSMTNDNQNGKKSYSNKNKHKGKSSRKNNNEKKKGSKTSRNSSKVASY